MDEILINANRSQARYQALAPVIGDDNPDYLGPLAGMQAGLAAARHNWVLFVPCDGPALPRDLMARFRAALTPATELVVAHDGDWLQPVVACCTSPCCRRSPEPWPRGSAKSISGLPATRWRW